MWNFTFLFALTTWSERSLYPRLKFNAILALPQKSGVWKLLLARYLVLSILRASNQAGGMQKARLNSASTNKRICPRPTSYAVLNEVVCLVSSLGEQTLFSHVFDKLNSAENTNEKSANTEGKEKPWKSIQKQKKTKMIQTKKTLAGTLALISRMYLFNLFCIKHSSRRKPMTRGSAFNFFSKRLKFEIW